MPPSWVYGLNPGSLITMLIGVLLGATLGTVIGTVIAYRRTERWIRKMLSDDGLRSLTVEFLKKTASQFENEYVKPKIESEEFRELVIKAKEQAVQALFGETVKSDNQIPRLDEFAGGDAGVVGQDGSAGGSKP